MLSPHLGGLEQSQELLHKAPQSSGYQAPFAASLVDSGYLVRGDLGHVLGAVALLARPTLRNNANEWVATLVMMHRYVVSVRPDWQRKGPELTIHSDRGSQYTSDRYRILATDFQMLRSTSRRSNCWENASMESVFKDTQGRIASALFSD